MNVSELETRLGMTRANIRYYEREGLLEPDRSGNGYRDYSEADVKALEKIKLLRQLDLSVETIRLIQQGRLPLSDAVRKQEECLSRRRTELEWAAQVCRDLSAAQVGYAELDARPYLEKPEHTAPIPRQDRLETVPHPWRRYLARTFDIALYGLIWLAFRLLVLRWNYESNFFMSLLNSYICFAFMLLVEPLLLATWGYTPGKWLLGLVVRDEDGQKLSLQAAWTRTMGVFGQGFGYGIPIYDLVRLWKCRSICLREENLDWEEGSYRLKDEKTARGVALCVSFALQLFMVFLIVAQALMPACRGDLTTAQYVRNINDAAQINRLMEHWRMDETGRWIDEIPSGTFVMDLAPDGMPSHQLTVTDGVVTGVRLEVEMTEPEFMVSPSTAQKQLAAIALVAAQRSYHCFSWPMSGVLKAIEEGEMENYTINAGGMTITNRVEYSGMTSIAGMLLVDKGGQAYYHMVFTIEKNT